MFSQQPRFLPGTSKRAEGGVGGEMCGVSQNVMDSAGVTAAGGAGDGRKIGFGAGDSS